MAAFIDLQTFTDTRGNLTVIDEGTIPFAIKRIFYIYGVDDSIRGGHRHLKTRQAAICIKGNCVIENNNGKTREKFQLTSPSQCLLLEPEDFHSMYEFSKDSILMVLASEKFDPADYIYQDYGD